MAKVTPTCGDDLKQLVPIPKGQHCNTFFLLQPLSRMSKCPFTRNLRGDAFQFTVKSVHTVMALCTNIPIHSISSIYNSCQWSVGLCSFALISLDIIHESNRWKYVDLHFVNLNLVVLSLACFVVNFFFLVGRCRSKAVYIFWMGHRRSVTSHWKCLWSQRQAEAFNGHLQLLREHLGRTVPNRLTSSKLINC